MNYNNILCVQIRKHRVKEKKKCCADQARDQGVRPLIEPSKKNSYLPGAGSAGVRYQIFEIQKGMHHFIEVQVSGRDTVVLKPLKITHALIMEGAEAGRYHHGLGKIPGDVHE